MKEMSKPSFYFYHFNENQLKAYYIEDVQKSISAQEARKNKRRMIALEAAETSAFWSNAAPHENLSNIALRFKTLFGSTYQCERLFSQLNFIKANIVQDWQMITPDNCWL